MSIQIELAEFKKHIDAEIASYLDETADTVRQEDAFSAELLVRVKKFVLAGGKRLRGALLYYGYKLAGGEDDREILKACVGIELVHNFFLVHDDIMDRDDKRHGVNTLHREFAFLGKKFFPEKDSDHFGTSMAITAGDLLGSMGSQRIFTSAFPADRIVRALVALQESISRTVFGQTMDMRMEYAGKSTEKEILRMYEYKTARYTFESPLHLGGILGGATDELLKDLSAYALPLGIAFQLQDDMLGVYGDSKTTGKAVGSDIVRGKRTLLATKALELGTTEEAKILRVLIGKADITAEEIEQVREIFNRSGARDFVQALERKYLDEGTSAVQKLPDDPFGAKEFLTGLAEFLQGRKV